MELEEQLGPEDLQLAARLATLKRAPSDEARARMMALVRSASATGTGRRYRWRRGWRLAAVSFGLLGVTLAGTGGALAASSEALPSSPAYRLRVAGENLRLSVTWDDKAKVKLLEIFASDRVRQAQQAVQQNSPGIASDLLHDASTYLSDAKEKAPQLPAEDRAQTNAVLGQLENQTLTIESEAAAEKGGGSVPTPVPSEAVSPEPGPASSASPEGGPETPVSP